MCHQYGKLRRVFFKTERTLDFSPIIKVVKNRPTNPRNAEKSKEEVLIKLGYSKSDTTHYGPQILEPKRFIVSFLCSIP